MKLQTYFYLMLMLPLAAQADGIQGLIGIDPAFAGGTGANDQFLTGAGTLTGSATGGFGSHGDAFLSINYGVIKESGDAFGQLNAVSRGSFQDSLTITAPGIATGTPGTFTYSISVTGLLDAELTNSGSNWSLTSGFNNNVDTIRVGGSDSGPGALHPGDSGDPFGVFSASVSFLYGVSISFGVELDAAAQAVNSFTSAGEADFDLSHSLYWNGITDVTAGGAPVDVFSVASQSGTPYANSFVPFATPEPGSATLFAGVLLAGLYGVRQRARA